MIEGLRVPGILTPVGPPMVVRRRGQTERDDLTHKPKEKGREIFFLRFWFLKATTTTRLLLLHIFSTADHLCRALQ